MFLRNINIKQTTKSLHLQHSSVHLTPTRCISNYDHKKENTIIIGNGPTGLAHAIEAIKKNKNIILVSDSEKFTRPQILSLRTDVFEYIEYLVGSDEMRMYTLQGKVVKRPRAMEFRYMIQIKTLEELLFNQLLPYKNKNIRMVYTDRRLKTMTIGQGENHLKFSNPYETIKFKWLIAADGARHDTFNSFIPNRVTYNPTQFVNQIHTKHATVTYTMNEAMYKLIEDFYQKPDQIPNIQELWDAGWNLYSTPENRVFLVDTTLYVGTEFPSHCEASKDLINQWTQTILKYYFPIYIIEQLDKSNPVKEFTAFDIKLNESSQQLIACAPINISDEYDKNTSYIINVGDAAKLPHYHTGSGAELGLDQAKVYGEALESPQNLSDLAEYNDKINKLLIKNRFDVNNFLISRIGREIEAKKKLTENTNDEKTLLSCKYN